MVHQNCSFDGHTMKMGRSTKRRKRKQGKLCKDRQQRQAINLSKWTQLSSHVISCLPTSSQPWEMKQQSSSKENIVINMRNAIERAIIIYLEEIRFSEVTTDLDLSVSGHSARGILKMAP